MINHEQEFVALINQHQKLIHKVCYLYLNDMNDREDLFQEITLQVWKSMSSFKGESKFSTWLYRIALNTAITFYRKERKSIIVLTEVLPDKAEETNIAEEQLKELHYAIGQLSKIEKALVMLYLENCSYNEIAEVLGITANNVAVKMSRIKTKLKELSKQNAGSKI
jgi:RNA polymerase sigma-70 factor (ECF subfamily)